MIITGSSISLSSTHETIQRHERREQLTLWQDEPAVERGNPGVGGEMRSDRARPAPAAQELKISQAANALQPSKAKATKEDELNAMHELEVSLLKLIVEHFTGRKLNLVKPGDLQAETQAPSAPPPPSGEHAAETEREGWGLVYDYYESHYEGEFTRFSAEGVIQTQDGRKIAIEVDLNMSREVLTQESLSLRAGDALKDPLVLNFNGNAAELTQTKFSFDIDADGREDQISFVGPGSGFLALDKNGDGIINNGSELFGPTSGEGFSELAAYDEDGNNWIDENDAVYNRLRIWSKDGEGNDRLVGLGEQGVGAIYLGHIDTPFLLTGQENEQLGQLRTSGLFLEEDGGVGTVQQLDLVV